MKIPFLNTKVETDLLLTLGLTPLWWVLGLNVIIYQSIGLWVFLKLLVGALRFDRPISIPRPLFWLFLFMLIYLASLLFNLGNHPSQRIFASLNNYLMFVLGFCLMLAVYNCGSFDFSQRLFETGNRLALVTAGITLTFLGAWWAARWTFRAEPLLAHLWPGLKNYPFFYVQWVIQGVTLDWKIGNVPRVSIYSGVYIATAGFMAMILPLSMGFHRLKESRPLIQAGTFMVLLIPFIFTLSRTAVCALAAAWLVVTLIEIGIKPLWCFLYFCIFFPLAEKMYEGFQWLFSVRAESTSGRMGIYEEAFSMVMEKNPLLGLGARPRDDFSTMIVGSHSHYVEMLLVTGILGLCVFLIFQGYMLISWFSQKKYLLKREHRILWKYLGISHLTADAVLLTSGLDSIPLTAFTYFLVAGTILYLGKEVQKTYAAQKKTEQGFAHALAL